MFFSSYSTLLGHTGILFREKQFSKANNVTIYYCILCVLCTIAVLIGACVCGVCVCVPVCVGVCGCVWVCVRLCVFGERCLWEWQTNGVNSPTTYISLVTAIP